MKALVIALCILFVSCSNSDRSDCGVNAPPNPPDAKSTHIIGQDLFKSNCSSCHKMHMKLIGPALADYGDSLTLSNDCHNENLTRQELDSIGKYIVDYRACGGVPPAN